MLIKRGQKCREECLKEARVLGLIVLCTIDALGGKERENVKKLRSQQVQTSETVRNKSSVIVTNNICKHSLLEAKRTASDDVCGSSEDMLPATKYKNSCTIPKHCCLKRKEAIEISACKVAEWLSIHDMSSNVDAQDSESDEGTMKVESESEGEIDGLSMNQEIPRKISRIPVNISCR